jgi:large subunit ribosomal protein L23
LVAARREVNLAIVSEEIVMTRIKTPESPTGGIQLEAHQVLLRPLVTEKGVHRASRNNQYAFEIHRDATKFDVKKAVEELFEVKVAKVRTQTRKGKIRRYRFRYGRTSDWKKAIVQLHEDHRIDFF